MRDISRDEIIVSYYRVRQALGYLGLFLPIALVGGGLMADGAVEPSISDYYHTVQRDIFVGLMCAIAIFLVTYPGHRGRRGEWVSDDAVTTLAGLAAIGVAFLPNGVAQGGDAASVWQHVLGARGAAIGQYVCAVIFLVSLGFICRVKFARTARPFRRRIYQGCGVAIYILTVLVIWTSIEKIRGTGAMHEFVLRWNLVLWFEALAVWAFSLAWLTKGRADRSLARMLRMERTRRAEEAAPNGDA